MEYEHLPFFCLFCGFLDHTSQKCLLKEKGDIKESGYSVLLNAEKKEQWLRQQLIGGEGECVTNFSEWLKVWSWSREEKWLDNASSGRPGGGIGENKEGMERRGW